MNHVYLGKVYAYEVDGYGNQYFMVCRRAGWHRAAAVALSVANGCD